MKKRILALCTLFAMALSCSKKDKQEPPPVNQHVKVVQEYLAQNDSLKTFSNSFVKVTLTDADAGQGLTVFAPVNSAITAYDPNARVNATELSETEVKDHIVKGLFKKSDLINGKKLTSLSGKELVFVVENDNIWVNGVLIAAVKEDSSHVVFTINNVLSVKPGKAEITVYDGTLWSVTDTLGKPVANANVSLYYTRTDYNSHQPAFTGKSDATGKITFAGLAAGTYYLIVQKDDKYNYVEPENQNESVLAYKPVGIYQNQAQIDNGPLLPGVTPGDFIFQDTNGDGKIDANDKTFVPFEITVTSNKTVKVNSLIGYKFNHFAAPFKNKEEAQQLLDKVYGQIGTWQIQQTVLDGILSDDADCTGLPTWCTIDNYSFTATNATITNFWSSAYSSITLLNRIIINLPLLNLPAAEADPIIAQAKALRSYVYLQLATYFGHVPLQHTIIADLSIIRTPINDVYNYIKSELTNTMAILPNKWSGADHRRISTHACKMLLARVAIAQNDFVKAKQYTGELMQSATYSLVNKTDIFVNDNNAEIIWNIAPAIPPAYSAFFTDTVTRNFAPAIRYSEVLLVNAEARFQLGELDPAAVNMLLMRRGQPAVDFTTPSQATDAVRAVWKSEQYREGQRFAKLVKWNMAMPVLSSIGFKQHNVLLPIPMVYLQQYYNIPQNPGY
jgi:starch-binding outer membrane protein, SusD/RagB family